jgi:hypothetical protein
MRLPLKSIRWEDTIAAMPPMTTISDPKGENTAPGLLPNVRAQDAISLDDPLFHYPIDNTHGKSHLKSLMCLQDLARRLLPRGLFIQLQEFCYKGCWTNCGPEWRPDIIKAAAQAGPHVSALAPNNVNLIWEDIDYQVRLVKARDLFGPNQTPNLKISRVAVVPQADRQGRTILNLSAGWQARKPHSAAPIDQQNHSTSPQPIIG